MNPTNMIYTGGRYTGYKPNGYELSMDKFRFETRRSSLPLVICSLEYDTIGVVVQRKAADFSIGCDCQQNHSMIHEILPVLQTAFL